MDKKKKKMVKCLVCGAVFEEGIEVCPICGVGIEHFVPYEGAEKKYQRNTKELFLILGNGAAGLSAAEAIRERNSTCSIVMVTDEEYLPYSRPMLTKSMAAKILRQELYLHPSSWYEENRILNLMGKRAVQIDAKKKEVRFADDVCLKYDKCVYALGAECFIPPIPGWEKPEVVAIRRICDVKKISTILPKVKDAVVIGGGVLGLEAAWELRKSGISVTILELAPQLMGRQLDAEGGVFLKRLIEQKGIEVKLNVKIEEIEGSEQVTGVRLGDGSRINGSLVIISAGVRANSSLAEEAGIETARAVVVNEYMETTLSDIYACGDCAQYQGVNYAIWPQAVEMGKVAGANAAGEKKRYEGVAAALTFNGMDTSLFAAGDAGKDSQKTYEVKRNTNLEKGVYRAFYEVDGKLCGAVLIGDTSDMGEILQKLE